MTDTTSTENSKAARISKIVFGVLLVGFGIFFLAKGWQMPRPSSAQIFFIAQFNLGLIATLTGLLTIFNLTSRFIEIVSDIFVKIAMILTGVMTAVILIQVVGRYCFNNSPSWAEESARFMMVWVTFLVIPYAYLKGLNVSMELFVDMIPRKLRLVIEILIHALIIAMAYFLLKEGLGMMKRGMRIRATSMDFKLIWVYAILPVSFGLMMIAAVERIFKDTHRLFFPQADANQDDLQPTLKAGTE